MLNDIHTFLGSVTPQAWVEAALANQDLLLLDHKNCEYKAANNAMSLMARYQESETLVFAMARLAREELAHHEQVMRIMNRLGGIELSKAYGTIKAISKKKTEMIAAHTSTDEPKTGWIRREARISIAIKAKPQRMEVV